MKNRRLIIILSVFLIITIIIVLCSTVFTLHTVDVVWLSTTKNLSGVTNAQIVESGNFKIGESVFLLNKSKYKNNLEKNNPYLKVLNMEMGFPNKLTLKVSEREELYALKVVNSASASGYSFVYLDYDLKVLKITNNMVIANDKNPAVLEILNYNLTDSNFNAGEFANLLINEQLITIGYLLSSVGYDSAKANALIKNIVVEYDYKTSITINTTYGLTIEISDALVKTDLKVLKALSMYDWYHSNYPEITSGLITIYERDGNVYAAGPAV